VLWFLIELPMEPSASRRRCCWKYPGELLTLRMPHIIKAENDILFDEHGRQVVDLFSANGTTWLGHCNPQVTTAVAEQLQRVWITGGLPAGFLAEAKSLVETLFPDSHSVAGFYSTGMEAAEFAIRVARSATGRTGVVGFERSMHGRSMATAYLGWDNRDELNVPCLHRLPFVHDHAEEEVLRRLEETLKGGSVSAVFVEPIQATGGGYTASPRFFEAAIRLCREHEALTVFDEILTGFYRTGSPFLFSELAEVPDIVLIGKAMGNGFPVSGVVVRRDIAITTAMLPGSTFAGNPLAAAAVAATLKQMRLLDLPAMVSAIERIIIETLSDLQGHGITLRGKGAMWIMELPESMDVQTIIANLYNTGVFVSFAGRFIRILPAATIRPENLLEGCRMIRQELLKGAHG